MASLEELRAQLGSVDDKIVELYEERMKLCEEIGICKIENGYKTFDRQREKNTITDVMNKVSSDINKRASGKCMSSFLQSVESCSISSWLRLEHLEDCHL